MNSKKNYLYYTLTFIGLMSLTYGIFALTGKSFIWEGDGLAQHYPILERFYTWLHQGNLAGWSWNLGLGADKVTTFSYYVLGDPFSYLIYFFPKHHLELGYNLLILLRLYSSGLAFMVFARQRHFLSSSQLLGTLAYTFSGFSLYVSIRHPFFLLPMILFPLLAYGIDRVYQGRSWYLLAIVTALALVSNFYFAYILAIGSLVYAILRYLAIRQRLTISLGQVIGRLLGAGLVGFLLAGVLFVPSLLGVLHSTRTTSHFANGYWLYPFNYYLRLPNAFLTTGNPMSFWVNLGMTGITFLACLYILRHFRAYLWLNVGLVTLLIGMLFPAIAALMNGGTTPSQRWLLLGNLLFGLAVMTLCDHLTQLTQQDLMMLSLGTLGWLSLVWAANGFIFSNHPHDFVIYGLLLVMLLVLLSSFGGHWSQQRTLRVIGIVFSLNVITNGYGYFSPNSGGASQQLVPRGIATKFQTNYYDGAQNYVTAQPGFSRSALSKQYYYANDAKTNMGMNLGTHDVMSYFSVQNGAVGDFSTSVDNAQFKMNKPIIQADSRTTLNNLLGVRYLFARSNQLGIQAFPYGYQPVKRHGKPLVYQDKPVHGLGNSYGTVILQSQNALPLLYLQPNAMTTKSYNRLAAIDREQAMTTAAVVDGTTRQVAHRPYHRRTRHVAYQVTADASLMIDSFGKLVTYRQQGNQLDPKLVTTAETSLRRHNQDRSVNIQTDKQRLQKLIQQNQRILRQSQRVNQTGVKQLTSDNQNQPITYRLSIKNPRQTRGTELYLALSGIQAKRFTVKDQYRALKHTRIFQNREFTGIERLNQLRRSVWNLSDGAYQLTASSYQNVNTMTQLGQSNLSDYQDKRHVLLNLGYSKEPRRHIKVTFKGVKGISFKSAKLIAVPFGKSYQRQMSSLQQSGLHHLKVQSNRITGNVTTKRATILTTSIPYSTGWSLKVNGRTVSTKRVNVGFVGAELPSGHQQIVLTYQTPGQRVGVVLSVIGLVILAGSSGRVWWRTRR